jgi:hypothetical protein
MRATIFPTCVRFGQRWHVARPNSSFPLDDNTVKAAGPVTRNPGAAIWPLLTEVATKSLYPDYQNAIMEVGDLLVLGAPGSLGRLRQCLRAVGLVSASLLLVNEPPGAPQLALL